MEKNNKKNNIIIYLCIILFAGVGVYLTFFAGNTKKFDRRTEAFKIEVEEKYDSDEGTMYQPIYYYQVKGKEYECESKSSSSIYPNKKKNKVYYDSKNPTKCLTEYDKSSSEFGGILCFIASGLMLFFMIKKPGQNSNNNNRINEEPVENQYQYTEEDRQKVVDAIGKISIIYKRVIIGIAILVLVAISLFDTLLLKQTIVSKDYPEATAEYVSTKDEHESDVFKDCIYTFTDKNGKQQEIVISISKDEQPEREVKIKYNEKDPQDYYQESSVLDKSGIIWYIVKVVAIILLIILFFNKKLLSKVNISASKTN